jgi:hypothetical protein
MGHCGITYVGQQGDCAHGHGGLFAFAPHESRDTSSCLRKCAACERCRYITILVGEECSWYWQCNRVTPVGAFRSVAVARTHAPPTPPLAPLPPLDASRTSSSGVHIRTIAGLDIGDWPCSEPGAEPASCGSSAPAIAFIIAGHARGLASPRWHESSRSTFWPRCAGASSRAFFFASMALAAAISTKQPSRRLVRWFASHPQRCAGRRRGRQWLVAKSASRPVREGGLVEPCVPEEAALVANDGGRVAARCVA